MLIDEHADGESPLLKRRLHGPGVRIVMAAKIPHPRIYNQNLLAHHLRRFGLRTKDVLALGSIRLFRYSINGKPKGPPYGVLKHRGIAPYERAEQQLGEKQADAVR